MRVLVLDGPALRVLRGRAGLQQVELARRLGCAAKHLGRVERGQVQPSRAFLLAAWFALFCEVSGCPLPPTPGAA